MVRVLAIALVAMAVFCSVAALGADEPCKGENEAKYPCGSRCEERCNVGLPGFCKGIRCMPPFGCRCKTGYARNAETGKCVRTQDCPPSQ